MKLELHPALDRERPAEDDRVPVSCVDTALGEEAGGGLACLLVEQVLDDTGQLEVVANRLAQRQVEVAEARNVIVEVAQVGARSADPAPGILDVRLPVPASLDREVFAVVGDRESR